MDSATRIGIGGCGIAVIFGLLPFVPGLKVTLTIVYCGMAIGGLIALWGVWPIFASLNLGHLTLWRIPLMDAARICYEKCEGTFAGDVITGLNDTPQKRLSYFVASFTAHNVPLFGEKAPSKKSRSIPSGELKNLVMREGTSDLMDLIYKDRLAYRNVYVKRPDLWKHLHFLKSVHGIDKI